MNIHINSCTYHQYCSQDHCCSVFPKEKCDEIQTEEQLFCHSLKCTAEGWFVLKHNNE